MNSPSQPSRRHHYVPQFYLRQWTDGGKLWCYKRERSGKLSETQVSPKATGFQDHLYSVRETAPFFPERTPDIIENKFFSPLDNDSSLVLQKLISGHGLPLNDTERTTWAQFLNSLLERDPRVLAARDEVAPAIAEEVLTRLRSRCQSAESRARLDNSIRRVDYTAMAYNSVREHMVREIRDKDVIDHFKDKSWTVVSIESETEELITSDLPLIVNCRHSNSPIYMLTLALSPNKIFLMRPKSWSIDEELLMTILASHNLWLIGNGGRYLYSRRRLEDSPIVGLRTVAEDHFGCRTEARNSQGEEPGD